MSKIMYDGKIQIYYKLASKKKKNAINVPGKLIKYLGKTRNWSQMC